MASSFHIENFVAEQIAKSQAALKTATLRLSSGLRINSAADDPSGLAISQHAYALAAGLDAGVNNVVLANNALNVAEGALQAVTKMVQRIRSLVVEAGSDINSRGQLEAIQTEIKQLLAEVNIISSTTEFNGKKLLDGSLDRSQAQAARIVSVPSTYLNSQGFPVTSTVVDPNATGSGPPGPLLTSASVANLTAIPLFFQVQVTGYDPINPIDPNSGPVGGPGYYVTTTAYSSSPAFGPSQQIVNALPDNNFFIASVGVPFFPAPTQISYALPVSSGVPNVAVFYTLNNITPADVGAAQAYIVFGAKAAGQGNPLSINSGSGEGHDVAIDIPNVSTTSLGLSDISVMAPLVTDQFSVSQGTSNQLAVLDSLYRVDDALSSLTSAQAAIGAQIVSLNATASDALTSSSNLTASASNIADLNVTRESTIYNKQEALASIQTSVLREAEAVQKSVLSLIDKTQ